jgi:hypothetical protein
MTAHSELVARLEDASEGSRELDILIQAALRPHDNSVWWIAQPPVTTSLDAALALAERVRVAPYTGPITLTIAGSGQAYIDHIDPCGLCVQAFGNTPALALCIAILRATATQPDGEKT